MAERVVVADFLGESCSKIEDTRVAGVRVLVASVAVELDVADADQEAPILDGPTVRGLIGEDAGLDGVVRAGRDQGLARGGAGVAG